MCCTACRSRSKHECQSALPANVIKINQNSSSLTHSLSAQTLNIRLLYRTGEGCVLFCMSRHLDIRHEDDAAISLELGLRRLLGLISSTVEMRLILMKVFRDMCSPELAIDN